MKLSNTTEIIQTLNTKLLFGLRISEKMINELISDENFPCLQYIYFINKLLMKEYYSQKDILNHKKIFYKNRNLLELPKSRIEFKINEEVLFNAETCLISKISCINLIERILKFGKFNNNKIASFNDEELTKILLLNVFETSIDEDNEYDEEKSEILNLYLSVISYNQFSNDINNSNYYRLPYIYENYIKNNFDILDEFKNKNGYSLKNYLLFLQIFLILGAYKNPLIESNFLNNSSDANEIKKCIADHIFDHNSIKQKSKVEIKPYMPSDVIISKPILLLDDKYLVINPGFLMSRIYGIFFQKIKLSLNNNAFFNKKFYGPLFENYCRDIARHYIKNSKFKYYRFVEPFKYKVDGKEKESSDFYVVYNSTVIIFEIKSTKRFNETTIPKDLKGKERFIMEEIDYKINKPLSQIEQRLSEIKKLDSKLYTDISLKQLQNSKEYYYIVVSEESIINNHKLYNEYLSKIKPIYSDYIPIYMNISEFEFFIMSMFRQKNPIDRVIEHYHKQYYSSNFIDMIIKENRKFMFDRVDVFDKYPYKEDLEKVCLK